MNDPLWDFSQRIYAAPGVAQECLALQDDHGVDVNILLFCVYVAVVGRSELSDDDLEDIERLVSGWRQAVVVPLRQCRRTMKALAGNFEAAQHGSAEALRERIKAIELEAERFEQERLMGWLAARSPDATLSPASDPGVNISRYLNRFSTTETSPPFPKMLVAAALASP